MGGIKKIAKSFK